MPIVHVREEESFENALRRFKRKCEKAGVLTELKKRQHFEKPSVKRKRKAMQAKKTSGKSPRTGTSPLILAVENGHFELAAALLEAGADPNQRNADTRPDPRQVDDPQDGWTALRYAQIGRHQAALAVLQGAGAR